LDSEVISMPTVRLATQFVAAALFVALALVSCGGTEEDTSQPATDSPFAGVTPQATPTGLASPYNPIFFDGDAVPSTIAGLPALYAGRNFEGQDRPAAYLMSGRFVVGVSATTSAEFNEIAAGLQVAE
jgi:hypothetical protein